jgi:hypothetical protein
MLFNISVLLIKAQTSERAGTHTSRDYPFNFGSQSKVVEAKLAKDEWISGEKNA